MAYQRNSKPATGGAGASSRGGYNKPAGGNRTPAKGKGKAGGNRPSYDLVVVDDEGQIVKEMIETDDGEREVSKRVGAIWTNEKGGMFFKFSATVPEGTLAKAFEVRSKD